MQNANEHQDGAAPTQLAAKPSDKITKNQEMMRLLQAEMEADPKADLLVKLRTISRQLDTPTSKRSKPPPPKKMDFCERLVCSAGKAKIIHPLSTAGTSLLASYTENGLLDGSSLVDALKGMILAGEKLWGNPLSGVVLKCNQETVAKIIPGNGDCKQYTEYTSIQFLASKAPTIPAPRPHGLIEFSNVHIMLMSYIPSTTLADVWPNITCNNKAMIQQDLQRIFLELRSLELPPGQKLGGVKGEGVQDVHMDDHDQQQVTTISAFEDFQFSVDDYPPSQAWTSFLRSFLPPPSDKVVFTHGDVRPANIMVKLDADDNYTVSGIIDWETSGFYPEYLESMQVLHLFDRNVENDWYKYLPQCISPARHPERFLVGRIWRLSIGYSAVKEDHYHTNAQ